METSIYNLRSSFYNLSEVVHFIISRIGHYTIPGIYYTISEMDHTISNTYNLEKELE